MGILDAPGLTKRVADTLYNPIGGGLSTLPAPIIIAHQGGGNVVPEQSLEAFRTITSLGATVIDMDTQVAADSSLPIMHDATVDRTTTSTGNVSDLSAGRTQQLVIDAGTWFGGGWGNCRVPDFADICREFGNKKIISIESKQTGSAAFMVAMAKSFRVDDDHLLWSSFVQSECDVFVAAGYTNVCILSADASITPATCVSRGWKWIGVSSASATPSVIAAYHTAGVKVAVYTIDTQNVIAPWIAAGVDAIWSGDPLYVTDAQTPRTTDPFASKAFWNGQFAHATRTDRGAWYNVNEWGFSSLANQQDTINWGWATPKLKANADTVQIDFSLAFDSFSTAATTNWAGLYLMNTDRISLNAGTSPNDGYTFYIRGDGRIRIYRTDAGVATQLQDNVSVGTPAVGAFMQLRINITPTTLRITRQDVVSSPVAVTDTTYRGLNYLQATRNGSLVRYKGVTLT